MITSKASHAVLRIWIFALAALAWLTVDGNARAQVLSGSSVQLDSASLDDPPAVSFLNEATHELWKISALNGFGLVNYPDQGEATVPFGVFAGSPSYSLMIGPDGSIGVGTPYPSAKLNIMADGPFTTLRMETNFPDYQQWDLSGSSNAFELVDHTNSDAVPFSVQSHAPTDSLFIGSGGSIGMGTSQPTVIGSTNSGGRVMNVRADNGPARFVLQGSIGGELNLVHNNAPANRRNFRIRSEGGFAGFHVVNDALTGYTVYQVLQIDMKTGNVGLQVAAPTNPLELKSGAHCTAGGVWTNASSRDLKQDIAPLTSEQARDAVQKLQPVGYRYKAEPEEQYVGFIAEDVPELVATKDRKSLAAMDITAVLTKVVQDQQTVITRQQQQLQRMNERLTRLEQRLGQE